MATLSNLLTRAIQRLKLETPARRVLTKGIAELMTTLGNLEPETSPEAPGMPLKTLLPLWNRLVEHYSGANDPDLCRWAFTLLLEAQDSGLSPQELRSLLLTRLPVEAWHLIPPLEKRVSPVMNTWTYQNEVMEWDIPADALVLDVGSGGWPFKRADHLADRYPEETTHRVETMVRDQRPFFEADLERLPFEEKRYDFVFCSHVLEHLDHPGQAMRELMRVGKQGYIEVPTRLSDVMFNFTRLPNHHRWHGLVLGDTLVLIEWNPWERRDLGNDFFNALQSDYLNAFQEFFERNRDLFFVSYPWVDAIKFLIIDSQGVVVDSSGA
ncbi:class I SAM-dependent methyltransferase [Nodosilinea sp. PGN35]|uniref:class I SAM-dependent methyltransferase n=1 Tax=Nodosilinea sp. PGN35 TaxID=3020489 RepID=UPI0023B28A82|nr:class I SAM-dependent methyltransferase [Nodosilinea sp. TSF1-S3]MDF0367610.1 class I SAM-dependent methyltransferase [Nodosilinea sp. TSF1-S3]